MKYIVLVGDGMADWPLESLGGKTVLEVANTPAMDYLASMGKMGQFITIPEGMTPGSEVANMSIMGYRPETDLTGRGPLEALSAGVDLGPQDIAFRCNLITIEDGIIKDYSAGHITTEEARSLIQTIDEELGNEEIKFYPGIQYRHILKLSGEKFSEDIICTPPHDKLDEPYKEHLIKPANATKEAVYTAEILNILIEKSASILIEHEVNKKRIEHNKRPATHVWFWSGGKKPNILPFSKKYGLNGAVISAVDLIFGLGIAAGLEPIHVKGATGLLDSNFDGKVKAALEALKEKDFVYLHVEAPDEMGHAGDPDKKIKAIEIFDSKIVKPIVEAEKDFNNELRIVVLPDHPTPIKIRTHAREPVPFVIYDPSEAVKKERRFTEEDARKKSDFDLIKNGEEFMKLFLRER